MIKFEKEFIEYLMSRHKAVKIDTACSYLSYLRRVDKQLYGINFHTEVTCLDDIKNLVLGLRATGMPERSINNCDVAMRAYLNFIDVVINSEKLFPEESNIYVEGTTVSVKVNRFERNLKARVACIGHHGVTCKVCDINFNYTYGRIGTGFIHVHHVKPLSEINQEYIVDPVNDLVPVCPNCHSMLHRKTPPYTILELKKIMAK
ncbi:HNH endonuclease [Vibrio ezurae]|uniref:HNH domain-containing protein n=1 Tax=Vibrio ezurae NBRC 102218 TaxID=1219080 RepID=U3AG07_9VIBR|nr:HNH endonuclease [Vibrio ezurae]GAD78826.1 hypothetical protein VEZ01S_07_00030 [Vibrio ezurae NBRC 102218]